MKNVFTFLWRNNFFLLFLVLEFISIRLVVKHSDYHQTEYMNSANQIAGKFHQIYFSVYQYFNLTHTNEQLAIENADLHNKLVTSFIVVDTSFLQKSDTVYKYQYQYTTAQVISNSVHQSNNYLLLNKGYADGISKDMGVITSSGIVGIVMDVSKNFSAVISILNKKIRISAKIKKNDQFGSVVWDNMDYRTAKLEDIPSHAKISKGDTIITSGYSLNFPQGIPIGIIEDFELKEGESFYIINFKFTTDFNKLNHVFIIKNLLQHEQEELLRKATKTKND